MLSWELNIVIFLVGERRLKLEEPKHLKLVSRGPIQPNTALDPTRKFHFLFPHQPRRRRRLYPLLSAITPASEQVEMKVTRGCKFSFHVTVVAAGIAYIYFSTVFVFIDQWLGLWSSPGMLNAVLFSVVALFCIFSYALAIYTDPGRVPSSFAPDVENPENTVREIKRKGGDLRYCQKCSLYKPPRAHHCRVCNRCVLRMDHHCVWMNNCVGHANYKIFFIFVLYAVIGCIYSLVLLVGSITIDSPKGNQQSEGSYRTVYIISGLLLVPLSLALSVFMGWHVHLILQNKTTIEYQEGVRAMWLAEKGGHVYSHPYDLGAYENLISVLGPNVFCWVCPTTRHIGSGLRYRTPFGGS